MKKTLLSIFIFLYFPICSQDYSDRHFVLPSPGENSGMFSVFTTVMGFLEFYDQHQCSGIKIDFGEAGLYYDSNRGPNWWNYYFEPVEVVQSSALEIHILPRKLKRAFTKRGSRGLTVKEGYSLIQKYIKIKPGLQEKIHSFVETYFGNSNVIGVHYRGTDKHSEAPRVPYEKVKEALQKVIDSSSSEEYKIFVATDEKPFLDFISRHFAGKVIYIDALRSVDGKGVHQIYKNCYKMGEDAVMDCILLSKCSILIRTASNLSRCAGYFNPELPIIDLNFLYVERRKGDW
ncbi:MAG TPA: hypothetical protein VLG49_05710 [Rhabdochlamydiaceae bacterium]|nr:hypothetical protein [Rhabdochlamydiaceae bacterium]